LNHGSLQVQNDCVYIINLLSITSDLRTNIANSASAMTTNHVYSQPQIVVFRPLYMPQKWSKSDVRFV